MTRLIRSRAASGDEGFALILVIGWAALMLGLVAVVATDAVRQIRPSDRSEHSYAALSAAEAGLADIEARLMVGTISSVVGDGSNTALRGWVPVPGGDSDAEFTYTIDATKSGSVGEVRAYSAGRSGDVVRILEAVLSKRSTLDYVYMSDIETPSPDTPGVYSTAQYGTSGLTYQQVARLLCDRRWVEPGPVKVSTSGTITQGLQRNLRFCRWAGIFSNEKLVGKLHTNDIWWLGIPMDVAVDQMMRALGPKREVYWVNLWFGEVGYQLYDRLPRPTKANRILRAKAKQYPNLRIIDFAHAFQSAHAQGEAVGWLDGVHLNAAGYRLRTQLIVSSLAP